MPTPPQEAFYPASDRGGGRGDRLFSEPAVVHGSRAMGLRISLSERVRDWLSKHDERDLVIDLVYRQGTCSGAFCRMIPSIEAYGKGREGRYPFVPVESEEGRTVHVAKPLVDVSADRSVEVRVERTLLGGLQVEGVDPYELGL